MDILRNLFGSLTSGIIRLAVAVGILAAAYFFIVKPVLKSVDETTNRFSHSFEKSFEKGGVDDIGKTLEDVNNQIQIEVKRSFHVAKVHGSPKKLVRCIKRADGNAHRIQRCAVKF
jgi:hypothetical protein